MYYDVLYLPTKAAILVQYLPGFDEAGFLFYPKSVMHGSVLPNVGKAGGCFYPKSVKGGCFYPKSVMQGLFSPKVNKGGLFLPVRSVKQGVTWFPPPLSHPKSTSWDGILNT